MVVILKDMDIETIFLPSLRPNSGPSVAYIIVFDKQNTVYIYLHFPIFLHFLLFSHKLVQFLESMHEIMLVFVCYVKYRDELDEICENTQENEEEREGEVG